MTRSPPGVIDLFAGAGGFSLGFHAAGARLLAAVDASEAAGDTYRKNFEHLQSDQPPLVFSGSGGDLQDLVLERLTPENRRPDILIGGPPCQGFSRLGRAKLASLSDDPKVEDPRNDLYRRFVSAAQFWQPRAVVMENVPGMLSLRGLNVADLAAEDLANCGYRVGYAVLNAVWYGVPQFRDRLFLIGFRRDLNIEPCAPIPTHRVNLPAGYQRPAEAVTIPLSFVQHYELAIQLERGMLPATTVHEALGDLPCIFEHLHEVPGRRAPDFRVPRPCNGPAHSSFARLMRRWPGMGPPEALVDHAVRRTPRDYQTFRRMRPGDRYPEAYRIALGRFEELLEDMRRKGDDPAPGTARYIELRKSVVPPYPVDKFVDKWAKLLPDAPSWTVPAHLAKDSYSHIHYSDDQARSISIREAARLQSFPDAFAFSGNMGDCFTQIGNAVPPLLAWAIAAQVMTQLGFQPTWPDLQFDAVPSMPDEGSPSSRAQRRATPLHHDNVQQGGAT